MEQFYSILYIFSFYKVQNISNLIIITMIFRENIATEKVKQMRKT